MHVFFVSAGDARTAYMKQKHKMIWERRHGKVGSGMKIDPVDQLQ